MKQILSLLLFYSTVVAQQYPLYIYGRSLDKNQVNALISTPNYKFWNVYGNNFAAYEVPKGKGTNANSANSIWIGGLDHNGALHISANTYRQHHGGDWWPGPLDTVNAAAFTSSNSLVYNQLWKVDCDDITNFVTAFNNGDVAAGTYSVPADILSYPARGIANFQRNMMPFYDVNQDGLYDPQHYGDYPLIRGQQQVLSLFNDCVLPRVESGGRSMGLEVYEQSYAYSDPAVADSMQAINYTTFYHYTVYNRSDTDYFQVHLTDWADVDLGYYANDLIGTDTINEFAYTYNKGPNDPNYPNSGTGYGTRLPVLSIAMIKTNCLSDGIDNDGDGSTDEAGEQFHMNKTTYYVNDIGTTPQIVTNPLAVDNPAVTHPTEYYNYMTGFWKDGTPFTRDSMGYGGTVPTNYVYSGDPTTTLGWSEVSANNAAGDRRILFTSGPFSLAKRSKIEWEFAVVFSQDTTANTNTIDQFHTRVQRDVRNVRYYQGQHQTTECEPAVTYVTGIKENRLDASRILVYPNPAGNSVAVELLNPVQHASVSLTDISGRELQQGGIVNTNRTQLDLSGLDKGIYFVTLDTGGNRLVKKIVKN